MNVDIEKEQMRDILRRCNIFVKHFAGINDIKNLPMILLKIKTLSNKIDIQKLFNDLSKYDEPTEQ